MYKRKIQSVLIALLMVVETIAVPMSAYGAQSVSENAVVEVETVETDGGVEEIAEPVSDVVPAEKATIKYSGVDGDLSWSIDTNGHLTVVGEGDYKERVGTTYDEGWLVYNEEIISATVDVSGIKSTKYMFDKCLNMVEVDLSRLDTSQVTTMFGMFARCASLETIDCSEFKTFSVTDMAYMFFGCSKLAYVNVDFNSVYNVTRMNGMFGNCYKLTELDISHFDDNKVTDMTGMFSGCKSLEKINLSNIDTSHVRHMENMFKDCSSLKEIDLSSFETDNVRWMTTMFYGCSSLLELDLSNFDTDNVCGMLNMFGKCTDLKKLDISGCNFDLLEKDPNIFLECTSIEYLKAPANVIIEIALPIIEAGSVWLDDEDNVCTVVQNKNVPVVYVKQKIIEMEEVSVDDIPAEVYNGKSQMPLPILKYQNEVLQKDKDYVLFYENNINPGTATIVITGKGKYAGTKIATFKIETKLEKASLDTLDYTYQKGNLSKLNSKNHFSLYLDFTPVDYALKYEIELTNNKGKKVESVIVDCANKDYVDKTIKNLTGAVYGVRIRAIRDDVYGDWSTKAFVLKQPRAQARSYNGNVQIKWEKINGATGYEIYMCDKRNGKYKKVATAGKNVTLKTVKKYNKKKLGAKTYYYYVVAKKKADGKTYKSSKNFVYKVVNK